MGAVIEFGFDFVTRSAFSIAAFFSRIFRVWIAALDHESLDDTMENCAVVKTRTRQFFEVLDRLGSSVVPELHDHIPFTRFDDCDFVGCIHWWIIFVFIWCQKSCAML